MNKATKNLLEWFFGHMFVFIWGKYLGKQCLHFMMSDYELVKKLLGRSLNWLYHIIFQADEEGKGEREI